MVRSLSIACVILAAVTLVAQTPPASSAPGDGLVVGVGNFFSPIVSNLDKAIAFYRDGLGLEVTGQPSNADENAPLRNMFGLPGAKLRWTIARPTGLTSGVEIIEISQAGGHALNRRIQDPGATTLARTVSDIDVVLMRLKALGATVASTGRGLVDPASGVRMVLVREPDNHFVELFTAGRVAGPGQARVRLTVSSLDRTVALYRDALGLKGNVGQAGGSLAFRRMLGVSRGQTRVAAFEVPNSPVVLEFMEFLGVDRRTVRGDVQDPGSTRLQLRVRDLDAAVNAVVRAGGAVISTEGKPVELPAGRGGSIRAAMVRDPDNLFLVLIQSVAPRP
jgi:catechol 2,3-dioxygenase-like lactoylglutathione lyase family enzyme